MKDKRFLKVRRVSEERYFRNNWELIRFIEKQNGMNWDAMCDMYQGFISEERHNALGKRFWMTQMNLDSEILIIGGFLFRIFRGYYERATGDYTINILAEQSTRKLTGADINQLFNIDLK